MKKILLLPLLFSFACSTQKTLSTDSMVVQTHPRPITVYEIGVWNAEYLILNLVDAKKEHFNIRVRTVNTPAPGAIYKE